MSYQKQRPSFQYQKPRVHQGNLRVPVHFYQSGVADGVDGRDMAFKEVYKTFAHVYNPSLKDVEISRGFDVKARLTIQIRHPMGTYQPRNDDFVEVKARGLTGRKWSIIDIRSDFEQEDFVIIVLGGDNYG